MDTYCSTDINELAKALIEVQKDMSPATKDGKNPFTKSNYATLNSVMESCREALLTHGIWLTQLPVPAPVEFGVGHIALLTKLTHAESGQWQSCMTVAPLPKNDPQGYGSALTYCRRYALTAMLGMVTEDDDGEAAKLNPTDPFPARRTAPQNRVQKGRQTREQQFENCPPEYEASQEPVPGLPKIDGITYEFVMTNDGRQCVIASGNTMSKKELLKEAGFRWNAEHKMWWKYADAA